MNLKFEHIATIAIGALLTVMPQVVATLPPKYRDLGTALIAALVSAWHLYQPSPNTSQEAEKK
jgi:hypothetical protein